MKRLRANCNWGGGLPELAFRDAAPNPKLFSQPLQRHEVVVGWRAARGIEEEHICGVIRTVCDRGEEHNEQCPVAGAKTGGLIAGHEDPAARFLGRHRHIRADTGSNNQVGVEVRGAKLPVLRRQNVRDVIFQIRPSKLQVRRSKI